MAVLQPPPYNSPIAEGRPELLQNDWVRYFDAQSVIITGTPTFFTSSVVLADQNASIGTTNIELPALSEGDYAFYYYARVTVPAGVSSSLTITFGWTESAVSLSVSGPAMTGNSVTTVQSGVVPVFIDPNTPLTYAVTYASNAANAMKYLLRVHVQALQ